MKIAFYKSVHTGIQAVYSVGVQVWTRSKYSHCEIIFSDGLSASASYMDGGVRFKQIDYDPDKWDIIGLPDSFEAAARQWFEEHKGQKYDLLGNIHFIFSIIGDDKHKWFCSEAVAAALGIANPERYNPGDLYPIVKRLAELFAVQPPVPVAA